MKWNRTAFGLVTSCFCFSYVLRCIHVIAFVISVYSFLFIAEW